MLRAALQTAKIQLKKTLTQPRAYFAIAILLVLLDYHLRGMRNFCAAAGVGVSLWGTIAVLLNGKNFACLLTVVFAFFICDLPGRDAAEPYILQRSGKTAWLTGKMIAVAFLAAIYMATFAIGTALVLNRFAVLDGNWGKILNTIVQTDAAEAYQIPLYVSPKVISKYTVIAACSGSMGMYFALYVCLGIWTLLLNALTGKATGNIVVVGLALLSREIGGQVVSLAFLKLSPVSWASLDVINDGTVSFRPTLAYSITGLLGGTIISIVLLYALRKYISAYSD